ncbi:uncharacterized protein B0H64DRAFT_401167 [Chaetomium fimeti]|uniref:Uncharacterized protein n=1 Tax=Chaetomium fimeti TaxID=1854472 RepID=A0AAE0LRB7_9PEZI|nr:hypothetical protein B0H64DRAFT_401167 [Chaetomium fimeti]
MSDMFEICPPERYRPTRATSSDSSDAGDFEISNVRLRVGAPPALPLPLTDEWDARCSLISDELGQGVLESETKKILSAENVSGVVSVNFTSREGRPTILIVAPWEDGSSALWGAVVRRVKKLVDSKRLTSEKLRGVDIAVEMIAEELTLKKYLSLVPTEILARGLQRDWPYIQDRVSEILEDHNATKGCMNTLSLFRLGFSPRHEDNPITVYVSLDYVSDETGWPPVVEEIRQYLEEFNYVQLQIHLEHNCSEY